MLIMVNHVCLGEARWGRSPPPPPPQGEIPKFFSRLDMNAQRCKFAKMSERRATSCGENPKNLWSKNVKHMGFDKLKLDGCPMI